MVGPADGELDILGSVIEVSRVQQDAVHHQGMRRLAQLLSTQLPQGLELSQHPVVVEIVSLQYHLRKFLLYSCRHLQLKLPQQPPKVAYVHFFKRRIGIECKLMLGVLIVGIGESLVPCVVGVGGDEHKYSFMRGDLKSLLPSISSEILIEALDGKEGTVMTSNACVML